MNNIDILRQYEPLWGHWRLGECIGSGAQSQVYSVTDEDGNSGALKVMSVDKACEEGAVVQEQLQLTESLSDVQGVVPCLKTGEFSTDEGTLAVILMPKLTPLNTLMMEREEEFSISEVLKIGRDLCSALEECRKLGIEKVLITCLKDNIGSARVIENNGGVFERETSTGTETLKRYWIELK